MKHFVIQQQRINLVLLGTVHVDCRLTFQGVMLALIIDCRDHICRIFGFYRVQCSS